MEKINFKLKKSIKCVVEIGDIIVCPGEEDGTKYTVTRIGMKAADVGGREKLLLFTMHTDKADQTLKETDLLDMDSYEDYKNRNIIWHIRNGNKL